MSDQYNHYYSSSDTAESAVSPVSPSSYYPLEYSQSQPLTRYRSSSASSQASSSLESPSSSFSSGHYNLSAPLDGNNYYYQQHYSQPAPAINGIERSIPIAQPLIVGERDWPVTCLYPNCNSRPFKRAADLQRHYRNAHMPKEQKECFWCDYGRCARNREPFHRRDHFRDHLRDYHREDIGKRGTSVSEHWYNSRSMRPEWWRCSRCLRRVGVAADGWDCPQCKTSCEPMRKEQRRLLRRREVAVLAERRPWLKVSR